MLFVDRPSWLSREERNQDAQMLPRLLHIKGFVCPGRSAQMSAHSQPVFLVRVFFRDEVRVASQLNDIEFLFSSRIPQLIIQMSIADQPLLT